MSSQLFHVDPEGLTQVKFFINVFDVGDDEGPFTFIPADDTARIIRDVNVLRQQQGLAHQGRYLDEEITAVGASSAIVRVTGSGGSGVAVDTSRCLHMGSRVRPGSFRLCLYIQYCTTRERGNAFDIERYKGDPFASSPCNTAQRLPVAKSSPRTKWTTEVGSRLYAVGVSVLPTAYCLPPTT